MPRALVYTGAALAVVVSVASLMLLPLWHGVTGALLGAAMIAIAVTDVDRFIIPDWLSLTSIPAGLLASGFLLDPDTAELANLAHLAGAVIGAAALWAIAVLYRRWRGVDGLGMGDVKLAGGAGAWVGIEYLPLVLLLAAVAGIVLALALSLVRRMPLDGRARMPFGAFLAPSIWIIWMLSVSGLLA